MYLNKWFLKYFNNTESKAIYENFDIFYNLSCIKKTDELPLRINFMQKGKSLSFSLDFKQNIKNSFYK